MTRKIIENKAQCKKCQDIIQSKSTIELKRVVLLLMVD